MRERLHGWRRRRDRGRGEAPSAAQALEVIGGGSYAAGATHVGRVREGNEDAYLCAPERGLFLIADGMGGHVAGEQASAATVRAVDSFLTPERLAESLNDEYESARELLCAAFRDADAAIRRATEQRSELHGMGSTGVIAVLRGSALHVANVGDSRAYLVRDGQSQLLSRDHSVAALLAEQGDLSPEDARTHLLRNQLTECLGGQRSPRPDYACVQVHSGDRVLLCSDGLWDMMSDEEMGEIVSESRDPGHAVEALVCAANYAGGHDNITAIVACTRR